MMVPVPQNVGIIQYLSGFLRFFIMCWIDRPLRHHTFIIRLSQ